MQENGQQPPARLTAMSTSTARRSLSPKNTRRWLEWSRPPWAMERPWLVRWKLTRAVSNRGTTNTPTGINRASIRLLAPPAPSTVQPARLKPRNRLPQSPMKILAGLKL